MKLPKSSGGDMIVHLIDSPEGQAELASHGLIPSSVMLDSVCGPTIFGDFPGLGSVTP
jgi:hypothetical protein